MVFSSLTFIYFYLPIVLLFYFISPMKLKNLIILISGLFFYAWGEPFYILIMLLSTAIDYTAGRFIHYFEGKSNDKGRFYSLLASLIMNLGLLAVFKYSSFFVGIVNTIFQTNIPDPKLPLPIGISFFTFQSMSYTIDLYLRNIKVQKSFISFSSYVSLFPQIVAGPIVRYEDVQNELTTRTINVHKVSDGISLFVKGLSKKVLLANNIGMIWQQVKAMDYGEISAVTAWMGILAFTFQIYFDFSGYSDMAVGLGKMLGFNFPNNFDHPYISKSISEFWRRWHITLGSWFRSYVYIPLGGNRGSVGKTVRNLAIVWFLTGLWHGASWNFVIWGVYFGALIIIERLFLGKLLAKLPAGVSMAYTFLLVVLGWVLFDVKGLPGAFAYYGAMFGGTGVAIDATAKYLIATNISLFLLCIFASTQIFGKLVAKLKEKRARLVLYASPVLQLTFMLICTAYLVNSTYNPFLYFNF